jgi:nitroreductase
MVVGGRVKGSDVRTPDRPIDPLFVDRWSPRAMTGESITQEELFRLFEAARWAPSSGNSQPWRMLYAHRDTEHWPRFFGLLAEGNKTWCVHAAVLVVFVSQTLRDGSDKVLPTHSYDTGSAWMSLAYQGWMSGYVVHGMAGFDYDRARTELGVPGNFHVNAMCAIGRPGPLENLSEALRARETPSQRKKVEEFAFEGGFRT